MKKNATKPKRKGVALSVTLSDKVYEAVQAYLAASEPRITRSAFFEYLAVNHLRSKGAWPGS